MSGFKVTHIDHVSVIITDVERSRRFYRDVLGLKEIAKPRTFDFVALWFDLGNQQLHLLLKDKPDLKSARHFALFVEDVPAARSYFRERGIPIEETTVIPGADRFFVYDPDSNRIEVIRWAERYDPAKSGAAELDGANGQRRASPLPASLGARARTTNN
jgi:catechol 2,3-dioxygenase-like lactoylglutathione lyase family enzyme